MSTEMATADQQELNSLLQQLGTTDQDDVKVPFLNTQYKPDDKSGRDVNKHRGSFYLSNQTDPVYAKTIKARFLCQHFQFRVTNPDTFKTDNKTVLLDDLRPGKVEPRDMKGGIRCGRPEPAIWKKMDDADKKKFSHVKAYRILRGIVSYTGETADGKEVTVENVPFQLFHKGMNFMQFSRDVEKNLQGGKFHTTWTDMSNKKDGMAYVTSFAIDHKTPAPVDAAIVETLRVFLELVKNENQLVETSYRNALSGETLEASNNGAMEALGDYLESDDLASDLD